MSQAPSHCPKCDGEMEHAFGGGADMLVQRMGLTAQRIGVLLLAQRDVVGHFAPADFGGGPDLWLENPADWCCTRRGLNGCSSRWGRSPP